MNDVRYPAADRRTTPGRRTPSSAARSPTCSTRQGQSWPWVEQDETEWLKWRPLFEHLEATADEAWGAELDGQLVGYARSIRRGRQPRADGVLHAPRGTGQGRRPAAARSAPSRRPMSATGRSSRPRIPAALSRYLRHGFRAEHGGVRLRGPTDGASGGMLRWPRGTPDGGPAGRGAVRGSSASIDDGGAGRAPRRRPRLAGQPRSAAGC